jgi:hypothetical protein
MEPEGPLSSSQEPTTASFSNLVSDYVFQIAKRTVPKDCGAECTIPLPWTTYQTSLRLQGNQRGNTAIPFVGVSAYHVLNNPERCTLSFQRVAFLPLLLSQRISYF